MGITESDPIVAKILSTIQDANLRRVAEDVVFKNDKGIEGDIDAALDNFEAEVVLEKGLLKGMEAVNELYGLEKYHLADIMVAVRVMNKGIAIVKKRIKTEGEKKDVIVMHVAEGDMHDLGKNIATVLLEADGFEIVDMGCNVPVDDVVREVVEKRPIMLTGTALMTASMSAFTKIAERLTKREIEIPFICAGGAVNRAFVESFPLCVYAEKESDGPRLAEMASQGWDWKKMRGGWERVKAKAMPMDAPPEGINNDGAIKSKRKDDKQSDSFEETVSPYELMNHVKDAPETPSLRSEGPGKQEPRYIQTKVRRNEKASQVKDPPAWVGSLEHLISVRIGPPDEDWMLPEAQLSQNIVFPDDLPPGENLLHVFLSEPNHLQYPLMEKIIIRERGPSSVAEFRITPRLEFASFRARIVIVHRNRILQTAILTGRVVKKPSDIVPTDRIMIEIESVVRPMLHDLERHEQFDMAMAVNHTTDGVPQLLTLADNKAFVAGFEMIEKKIGAISQRLSVVAKDSIRYEDGLYSTAGVELFRFLAEKGRALYDFLILDQNVLETLKDVSRIQIVNLTSNSYFPAEFIYDFGLPAENATICPKALKAFDTLDFSQICSQKDHETNDNTVVCPFGFWGLRNVIERHAYLPKDRHLISTDFVLEAEPSEKHPILELSGYAILGVSKEVDAEKKGSHATADLLQKLQEISPIPVEYIPKWQNWTDRVQTLKPSLIVALPHAEKKDEFEDSEYSLEIGGEPKDARLIGAVNDHFVRGDDSPSPLVFLLGCNTTVPSSPIDSIVGHFRRGGAAIVVSTVGTVLGSHACKATEELVKALFIEAAVEPRPLGDLLLDVRRRCIGNKVLMALCIVAFGDADWDVHAAKKGSA